MKDKLFDLYHNSRIKNFTIITSAIILTSAPLSSALLAYFTPELLLFALERYAPQIDRVLSPLFSPFFRESSAPVAFGKQSQSSHKSTTPEKGATTQSLRATESASSLNDDDEPTLEERQCLFSLEPERCGRDGDGGASSSQADQSDSTQQSLTGSAHQSSGRQRRGSRHDITADIEHRHSFFPSLASAGFSLAAYVSALISHFRPAWGWGLFFVYFQAAFPTLAKIVFIAQMLLSTSFFFSRDSTVVNMYVRRYCLYPPIASIAMIVGKAAILDRGTMATLRAVEQGECYITPAVLFGIQGLAVIQETVRGLIFPAPYVALLGGEHSLRQARNHWFRTRTTKSSTNGSASSSSLSSGSSSQSSLSSGSSTPQRKTFHKVVNVHELFIPTTDNPQITLHGAIFSHPHMVQPLKSKKWLIYVGGNAEVWEYTAGMAYELAMRSRASNVVVFNFRGVGLSGGRIKRARDLIQDLHDVINYFLNFNRLHADPANPGRPVGILADDLSVEDFIVFGHSIGGGVAAQVAVRYFPRIGLILDRTFSSLTDAAVGMVGFPRFITHIVIKSAFGDLDTEAVWPSCVGSGAKIVRGSTASQDHHDDEKHRTDGHVSSLTRHFHHSDRPAGRTVVTFHRQDAIIPYEIASLATLKRKTHQEQQCVKNSQHEKNSAPVPLLPARDWIEFTTPERGPMGVEHQTQSSSRQIGMDVHNCPMWQFPQSDECIRRMQQMWE